MGAQPQFGEMISLLISMQLKHQHETEKRFWGKKKKKQECITGVTLQHKTA